MKVDIKISEDIDEPYVVIHTNIITDKILSLAEEIADYNNSNLIIGKQEEQMVILHPEDIYIIRVENEKTYIVGDKQSYRSNKRLYELLEMAGKDFMQISKSAAINLSYLSRVEPYFNGVMIVHMKNGEKEYISRKYVPELKKYLGL